MNIRQQIIDELQTRMESVTGVKKVTQWRVNDLAPAELPAINIKDTTDQMPSDGVIGRIDHSLEVELTAVIHRNDTAPTVSRQLIADMIQAIGTDPNLNSLAYDTVVNSADLNLDTTVTTYANATINITVNYRTGLWSI